MKATKKTTEKTAKKELVVDFTNLQSISDAYMQVYLAKARANMPLSADDVMHVYELGAEDFADFMFSNCNAVIKIGENVLKIKATDIIAIRPYEAPVKKPNIFKRAWNWLTKPFRKNK